MRTIGRRTPRAVVLAGLCALTVLFLVVRDLFVPAARDTEVWLGVELRGALARLTAPLHWAIFAGGAWAFLTERPWIWLAAPLYATYIALSHLIWNLLSPSGGGWAAGLWQLGLLLIPAVLLRRLRPAPPARGPAAPGARSAARSDAGAARGAARAGRDFR